MRQLIQVEGAPIPFLTSNNLCLYRPLAVQARVLTCKADSSPGWLFSYHRMVSLHPPSPVMAADIVVAFRSSWGCQHLRSSRGWESVPLLLETHRSWWVVALVEIITQNTYCQCSDWHPLNFQIVVFSSSDWGSHMEDGTGWTACAHSLK